VVSRFIDFVFFASGCLFIFPSREDDDDDDERRATPTRRGILDGARGGIAANRRPGMSRFTGAVDADDDFDVEGG
jgi:hypothetical protein